MNPELKFEQHKRIRVAIRRKYVEFIPVDEDSWFYEVAHFTNKKEVGDSEKRPWVIFKDLPDQVSHYAELSSKEATGVVISYPDTNEIIFSGAKKERKKVTKK